LERSYAAPAVAGSARCDEVTAMQPLTKKQRRGEDRCGYIVSFASVYHPIQPCRRPMLTDGACVPSCSSVCL
jgi:hypothetical protein